MQINDRACSVVFRHLPILPVIGIALMLGGCIDISTRIQPDNMEVPATKEGSDCVLIIFGLGGGVADIDRAMSKQQSETVKGRYLDTLRTFRTPYITRIRRVEIQELMFLFFGARCINVTGE